MPSCRNPNANQLTVLKSKLIPSFTNIQKPSIHCNKFRNHHSLELTILACNNPVSIDFANQMNLTSDTILYRIKFTGSIACMQAD